MTKAVAVPAIRRATLLRIVEEAIAGADLHAADLRRVRGAARWMVRCPIGDFYSAEHGCGCVVGEAFGFTAEYSGGTIPRLKNSGATDAAAMFELGLRIDSLMWDHVSERAGSSNGYVRVVG